MAQNVACEERDLAAREEEHERQVAPCLAPPAREQRRQPGVGLGEVLELVQDYSAALRRETLDGDQGGGPGGERLLAQQRVAGGLGQDAREVAKLVGGRAGSRLEEQAAPAAEEARQKLCLADPPAPPYDQQLRRAPGPSGLEQVELVVTVEKVHGRSLQDNCAQNKYSCTQFSCRRISGRPYPAFSPHPGGIARCHPPRGV